MVGVLAVAAVALLLLVVTARTARRPSASLPGLPGYYERWSKLHGGYDPTRSRVVAGWLRIAFVVGRPLARRGVAPDALTGWGLLLGATVPVVAAVGGRWPLLAAALVTASGLVDNLDGAVAVLTDRASRFGYVLDSVVDRLVDGCYLVALWRLGAPAGWCVAAGAGLGLLEYTRARATAAGMDDIGVVTVGERPTRIVLTAMTLLSGGLYLGWQRRLAATGAVALLAVSVVGLAQLARIVRRRLDGG